MFKKYLLFILLSLSLSAKETKDITLVLQWKHQFQFAGYYMAKELGLYEDAGLNVNIQEYNTGRDNSKDVATQKAHFGVGYSSLILDKLNAHPNLVLLSAIHQSSPFVLLSKKRDDLQTIADIANKKMILTKDNRLNASVTSMLYSQGIHKHNLQFLENNFTVKELINGEADIMVAYISNEPFILSEKGIEYTIFDPKDYGYNFYNDILFTSKEMIEHSKEDVEEFRKASLQGWIYAYENIDEAVELILKKYNTQSRTKKAFLYEANTLKERAFVQNIPFGNIDKNRIQEITTTYRLLNLIENNAILNLDEFVYPQLECSRLSKKELEYNVLTSIYERYQVFIILIFVFILFIFMLFLYFRYTLKKSLLEKTDALNKQYKIFDNYVSSSRTDLRGNIIYASKAFMEQTGYTQEELIGKNHNIFNPLKNDYESNLIYKDLWMSIKSGHTWKGEFKNFNKDGSEACIESVISPVFDAKKKIIGYEAIRIDVTAKKVLENFNKKLEEEVQKKTAILNKLATTDKLTGIYNRLKIDDELLKSYQYFTQHHEEFSLIIFDIDYFKKINDTHGHQVGDIILKEFSTLVQTLIRSSDTFGRWGGEEFMLICPKTDIDSAYSLASTIVKEVSKHQFSRVKSMNVSAGVCSIENTQSVDQLIQCTDQALYKAKELGRNRAER